MLQIYRYKLKYNNIHCFLIEGGLNLNRTVLVIGIIFLLIGASVVSSTEPTVDDNHSNYHPMESNIESKEILSRSDIAYGYIRDSGSSGLPEGPCYFYLDDPGNIYSLAPTESAYFLGGGTWSCDGIWYGWEYATGHLWIINPNNGEMNLIGGGGGSCNGLSWDPVSNRLYGISDSALMEINHEDGQQEVICRFNGHWHPIGIAFNGNGTLYGWFDNLWIMEACKLTLVGPLGIWAEYGHFDYDTDKLYLSTHIPTSQLYECDVETGNCTLIGDFEGGAEITCLAIPYDFSNQPPDTPTIIGPTRVRPGTYEWMFKANDPDGAYVSYEILWGDGTTTDWTDWHKSGEPVTVSHTYYNLGTVTIKARAMDIHLAIGDWGAMNVEVPKIIQMQSPFWYRVLERFPIYQKILSLIIK
jgi:hypothetical protein